MKRVTKHAKKRTRPELRRRWSERKRKMNGRDRDRETARDVETGTKETEVTEIGIVTEIVTGTGGAPGVVIVASHRRVTGERGPEVPVNVDLPDLPAIGGGREAAIVIATAGEGIEIGGGVGVVTGNAADLAAEIGKETVGRGAARGGKGRADRAAETGNEREAEVGMASRRGRREVQRVTRRR